MTLIVQLAPEARLVPQVLVCVKLLAFDPPIEIPVIVSAALPGLLSVTGSAEDEVPAVVLGNESDVGLSTACGAGAGVPVPLIVADCCEVAALSETSTLVSEVWRVVPSLN